MSRLQLSTSLEAALLAIVLLAFNAAAGWGAEAAEPQQAKARPIAFLDLRHVFENFTRFKAALAELRADVRRAESSLRKAQQTIRNLKEKLNQQQSGTPEHEALEEEITHRRANLDAQMALQKKEFLQREAKIYHTFYEEVELKVAVYAKNHGIAAVLRFSNQPVNADTPIEVLRDINKPVIWFSEELDITPIILDQLNRQSEPPEPDRVTRTGAESHRGAEGDPGRTEGAPRAMGANRPKRLAERDRDVPGGVDSCVGAYSPT